MAQLVEQRIRNAQVVGSSPTISSRKGLFFGTDLFFFEKITPDARIEHRGFYYVIVLFDFSADCFVEKFFDFSRGLFVDE